MAEHTVKEGEDLATIAKEHGFFRWESIYYHEKNSDLRKKRPNPGQLMKDDVVHIPEEDDREELCRTGMEHVFQLRPPPTTAIHLMMEADGIALSNRKFELRYTSEGNEEVRTGYTGREGELREEVAVDVIKAELKVWETDDTSLDPLVWNLDIGFMDPLSEDSGVQDRLRNLGYDLGDEDGEIGEKTKEAIKAFQSKVGLEATGEIDDATRKELDERAHV